MSFAPVARASHFRCRLTHFQGDRGVACGLEVHCDGQPSFLCLLFGSECRESIQTGRVPGADYSGFRWYPVVNVFEWLVYRELGVGLDGSFAAPRCIDQVSDLVHESRRGLFRAVFCDWIDRGADARRVRLCNFECVVFRRKRVFVNDDVRGVLQAVIFGS